MSSITHESFLDCLEQSNLLDAEQLQKARNIHEDQPSKLAEQLVQAELLTPWQAHQLLAGYSQLTVGKYKLLRVISNGAMGTVYLARTEDERGEVALKVVSQEALSTNPNAAERFLREVKTLSKLGHPNIVQVYDEDHDGDLHFLVMEYVKGQDLKAWLRRFPRMEIDWSCEVVRQTALGLQHAHERGFVHRDVKPSNLLVVADDLTTFPQVKILDWGVVRLMEKEWEGKNLTYASQILGTPDYMAPEQAYDPRLVDVRADIYGMGCTLFRMVTGRVPFEGNSPMEKLMARAGKEAPRASKFWPDIPPALDAVIGRMLAHDLANRYQTPAEVAEALAPFCMPNTQGTVEESSESTIETAPPKAAPLPFPAPVSRSATSDADRKLVLWIIASAAVSGLVSGLTVWLLK